MTRAALPFVASMLLRFVASEHPSLAGDLEEERRAGRSTIWFWRQLLEAVAFTAWKKRRVRPTVVRLVTTTPYNRPDRTVPMVDPATINLSGTKVRSVGGLGLLAMVVLVSIVMPQAWVLVAAGLSGGIIVGVFLVRRRRRVGLSGPPNQRPIGLFDETPGEGTPAQAIRGACDPAVAVA